MSFSTRNYRRKLNNVKSIRKIKRFLGFGQDFVEV